MREHAKKILPLGPSQDQPQQERIRLDRLRVCFSLQPPSPLNLQTSVQILSPN